MTVRYEDPCWWCNGSGQGAHGPCTNCNKGYVMNDAGRRLLKFLKKYEEEKK